MSFIAVVLSTRIVYSCSLRVITEPITDRETHPLCSNTASKMDADHDFTSILRHDDKLRRMIGPTVKFENLKTLANDLRMRSQQVSSSLNATKVFVTLATLCPTISGTDPKLNLKRAIVLGRQLQSVGSLMPLVVLISDYGDCDLARHYDGRKLDDLNMEFLRVPNGIFMPDELPQPEEHPWSMTWKFTYPKSYIWALTGFSNIVYLDNDVVILQNIDDLFDSSQQFGVQMAFNQKGCNHEPFEENLKNGGASNLMVLVPNVTHFHNILELTKQVATEGLMQEGRADDQAIIYQYFKDQVAHRPPEDLLFSECLTHFDCSVGNVRVVHLGGHGKDILRNMCNSPGQNSSQFEKVIMRYVNFAHDAGVAAQVDDADHLC